MGSIRAATFNILHGQRADRSGVDLPLSAWSAAALSADVLALQEVDHRACRSGWADQAAAVAAAAGMRRVFGRAAWVGVVGRYGNALLARGAITDVEVMALHRAERGNERRVAILATVTLPEVTLSVAATHLSVRRSEVLVQLAEVVGALAARPAPRLLLGDLNLVAAEVTPITGPAGLQLLAGGGPSYPRDAPTHRIDHVAVAGLAAGPDDVEVMVTPSSDHCAVVARLTVPDTIVD